MYKGDRKGRPYKGVFDYKNVLMNFTFSKNKIPNFAFLFSIFIESSFYIIFLKVFNFQKGTNILIT